MNTTLWLVVDEDGFAFEAHVTEHEAVLALREQRRRERPLRVVAVEVGTEAGRTDWTLVCGIIERVEGTQLASELADAKAKDLAAERLAEENAVRERIRRIAIKALDRHLNGTVPGPISMRPKDS